MSVPGQTIDRSASEASLRGAVALQRVADLLDGRELTPAMGRWIRRLAATFSSWHDRVFRAMETQPVLALTDSSVSVEARAGALAAMGEVSRGLGPRSAHGGVVPVAVAVVELVGTFGPTFAPLAVGDPEAHAELTRAVDLAPAPFGSRTGLTSQFVEGVMGAIADVGPTGSASEQRRLQLDDMDVQTIAAIRSLRHSASHVRGEQTPTVNDGFDPRRVAALAAVLDADDGFAAVDLLGPDARRVGPLALAATADFAAVARPDERIAAGLTLLDRRHGGRIAHVDPRAGSTARGC